MCLESLVGYVRRTSLGFLRARVFNVQIGVYLVDMDTGIVHAGAIAAVEVTKNAYYWHTRKGGIIE